MMVLLAAVVLLAPVVESCLPGHSTERPVRRRANHEITSGRRGQRRAVRRPGTAVHPPGSAARRARRAGRLVVGTLGNSSVPVRFVNIVIIFYNRHHESHGYYIVQVSQKE